jgi:branched-chain amino acid transport system substrate-binding protein
MTIVFAGAPIINQGNLPMVTLSSNPTITQQGFKNLFRPIANDNVQGKAGVAKTSQRGGSEPV